MAPTDLGYVAMRILAIAVLVAGCQRKEENAEAIVNQDSMNIAAQAKTYMSTNCGGINTQDPNELHDCQELIVYTPAATTGPGSYAYGPRAEVFTRLAYATMTESDFDDAGTAGVLAAEVYSDGKYVPPVSTVPAPGPFILGGRTCFYLKYDSTTNPPVKRWSATATKSNPSGLCPDSIVPTLATLSPIDVKASVRQNNSDAHGARWDWDAKYHQQLIGVKCLDHWCELGPKDFDASPAPTAGGGRFNKAEYDDQFLADNSTGQMVPAITDRDYLKGVIEPTKDTKSHKKKHFLKSTGTNQGWQQVATIYLIGDYKRGATKYERVMHLDRSNQGNKVWLRLDDSNPNDIKWEASIGDDPNAPKYKPTVTHEAHHSFHVPGNTRWGWQEDDESLWVRCGDGCCGLV